MALSSSGKRRYGSTFSKKQSSERLVRTSFEQPMDTDTVGEEEVKKVFFAPFILSVGNICPKELTVQVEIEVSLRWSDPSAIESYPDSNGEIMYKVKEELCNESDDENPWNDEIWTPNLIIDDADDENDGRPEQTYSWEVVRDPETQEPMLHKYVRFNKKVKQKFSLADFPFERFNLTIFFALDDQSNKEAVLKLHTPDMLLDCSMCFGDGTGDCTTSGSDPYKIMGARIVPDDCTEDWSRVIVQRFKIKAEDEVGLSCKLSEFSNLELRIDVARKPFYYTAKILSIMVLVMLIGASTFAISTEDISDRLAQGITIFLTLVAFQFAVAADLPQLPYLTTLDKLTIVTYCLVTSTILENVAVASIQSSEIVETIETLSLVSYLSGMGLALAWLLVRATKSLSTVPKEFEYKYYDTEKYLTGKELEEIKKHKKYNSLWVNAAVSPDTED